VGDEAPSKLDSRIYAFGLATIGEKSYIPKNVKIGKNTAISGRTETADYPDGELKSGEYIIKAGEM
jgi:glucose-1-phosphate adenylyltransferase